MTKSGPATAVASDTMKYAIVLSNVGPSTAYSVVASDALPAGATFVRSTNGGTYATGVVTWPAVASIALGATVTDSVIALAPSSTGTIVNVASATAGSFDPVAANNDGSAASSRVSTTVTAAIAVTPDGLASPVRRLPGTKYGELFTVSNQAYTSGTFALTSAASGSPVFMVIDSMTSSGITLRPRADSALATIAARTAIGVTVWYTVAVGDTAIDTLRLRARNTAQVAVTDTGYVQVRRSFPSLTLAKSVTPTTNIYPGIDLTYTMRFANAGESDAANTVVTDQLPLAVQFKLGSTQQSLPSGVTAAVSYSRDGGTTWTYSP
ncbi:MAG: DUF11 domain-containing protein, partial [Myxococcales bacterium]|nr:DUF11 domain-containing protein [Myxococcales bacterium]